MDPAGTAAPSPPDAPDAPGRAVLLIRRLGLRDYQTTWQAMREFTDARREGTPSEVWLVQHPPVFTQGQAGRAEHVIDAGDIPVVQTDRGGQVTYHGPGQLVLYLLLSLRAAGLGVRGLVTLMEQSVIDLLATHGIEAQARADAPGVYVDGRKIASLGLRVRRGCSYHGLALNVDNDLEPFHRINPCGFPGLAVTRTRDLGINAGPDALGEHLAGLIARHLGWSTRQAEAAAEFPPTDPPPPSPVPPAS
jgi:lipoyl(octanoyl) transferase